MQFFVDAMATPQTANSNYLLQAQRTWDTLRTVTQERSYALPAYLRKKLISSSQFSES